MRPLARQLGVEYVLANRMEFRDGIATGRLLDPVIRPRGIFARISSSGPDGTRSVDQLARDLGVSDVSTLECAVTPSQRTTVAMQRPIADFENKALPSGLSVGPVQYGKHVLLIAVTQFVGNFCLWNTLMVLHDIRHINLLVRRRK